MESHLEVVGGFLDMGAAVMAPAEVYSGEQQDHLHQELQLHREARHEVRAQEEGKLLGSAKGEGDAPQPLDQREDSPKSSSPRLKTSPPRSWR